MDTSNVLLGAPGVEEQWAPNIYQGLRDPWTPQVFSQEPRGWAPNVVMGTQGAEEPMDTSNVLLGAPGVEERWAANIYQGLRDPWKPQGFFWGDQELSTQRCYGDPRG